MVEAAEPPQSHFGPPKMPALFSLARIRHQCLKTTVFSSHRRLINTGVEKNELHRLELLPPHVSKEESVSVCIETIVYTF
jgi:hypothetical protein